MAYQLTKLEISNMQRAQGADDYGFLYQLSYFFNDIVERATFLKEAIFSYNNPNEYETNIVVVPMSDMTFISHKYLTYIDLDGNDFSLSQTSRKIAKIIDMEDSLRTLSIKDQIGAMKIHVDLTLATSATAYDGSIVITDVATQGVIVSQATGRTSELTILQDQ